MAITQLECFRATMAHQPHEGVLLRMNFSPDLEQRLREKYGIGRNGSSLAERFNLFDPVKVVPKPPSDRPDNFEIFGKYFDGMDIPPGSRITSVGCLRARGSVFHFDHLIAPLRDAKTFKDIENFPYPRYEGYSEEHMAAEVERAHAEGKVAVGGGMAIFEAAYPVRGIQDFLTDMAMRPEWSDYILEQAFQFTLARAKAVARAGVDFIGGGDDLATQQGLMMSPDFWERFIKPRWAKVIEEVKAIAPECKIKFHSDGNVERLVPELVEIGVDILNPVQPECVDPFMVKERWGDRLVLDGCVGTQSTMPFGTPDDVRRVTREYVERLGADGALILAPTHKLEPEVPIENVEALAEVVKEFGEVI